MSMPTSFEDQENLYDYLRQRGLGLRNPSPVLRLRQPPPMPETYRGMNTGYPYVMQAPEQNPDYAFVGNRDNFSGNWHRLGDPVTEDAVGKTTYGHIGEGQRFQPGHHNMNLPRESSLTEEQLRGELNGYNLPTNGERSSLFKRMINTKESDDIMQKLGNGERPSELEMADVINRHEPINLQEAGRLRGLRQGVNNPNIQHNVPNRSISQQVQKSNLNPMNWRSQNNPMRVDGTQVSNVEASALRDWGKSNLNSRMQSLGTAQNPMTLSSAQGVGEAAAENSMAAAAPGTLSRAMPMLSLALMAGSMVQNAQIGKAQEEQMKNNERMRT